MTAVPAMAAAGQSKPSSTSAEPGSEFAPTVPLLMDVAQNLATSFVRRELNEELMKVRRALYFDLGVPFPGINLRFNDNLAPGTYAILLHEVPVASGELRPEHLLARESEDTLKALGVEYETGKKFLPNLPTIWVPQRLRALLAQAGTSTMDATQLLTYHLAFVLKKYAADFIGIQETRFLLGSMDTRFPDLVKEVQRVMAIQKIAEILQRLVSEEISIRNLRTILEALIEWGQKEKDSVLLTEYIRAALKRHLSHKYSTGQTSCRPIFSHRMSRIPCAVQYGRPLRAATWRSTRMSRASCSRVSSAPSAISPGRRTGRCCSPRWTSAATSAR